MKKVLAFDVYGTLINPHGVVDLLQQHIGEQASAFSETWRQKQLEYSFRRGLMQQYENFSVCTAQALEYTCQFFNLSITTDVTQALLEEYLKLPAFDEVATALKYLKNNHSLVAFSNGTADDINKLLNNAGLIDFFDDIISTDEIKSFKPNPEVYQHLLRRAQSKANNTWLISSNAFDVLGAMAIGLSSAWIKRSANAVFDPWNQPPTLTCKDLLALSSQLSD